MQRMCMIDVQSCIFLRVPTMCMFFYGAVCPCMSLYIVWLFTRLNVSIVYGCFTLLYVSVHHYIVWLFYRAVCLGTSLYCMIVLQGCKSQYTTIVYDSFTGLYFLCRYIVYGYFTGLYVPILHYIVLLFYRAVYFCKSLYCMNVLEDCMSLYVTILYDCLAGLYVSVRHCSVWLFYRALCLCTALYCMVALQDCMSLYITILCECFTGLNVSVHHYFVWLLYRAVCSCTCTTLYCMIVL
jgi:hypothetical protein